MSVGQLLITGISGLTLKDEERDFLSQNDIGGVILFKHNFESPAQLAELCNSIQECRNEYPLFIAIDHEGGRVNRFRSHFTQIPSMYDIGLLDSPKTNFEIAQIIATELLAVGINTNFSPVCDVLTNPDNKAIGDRAFSEDPESVSKHISGFIRGFRHKGIISCAKHFPGHGDTSKDSHFSLPLIKKDLDSFRNHEFIPFTKAAKSKVDMFMMAHLIVEAIDPDLPTSLSPKAYDLLRKEMRFDRVIVTDDMVMGAITGKFGCAEAAVMAISAGADIIEYKDFDQSQIAYEALKKAYEDGELDKSDISQKISRINDCKIKNLSSYKPIYIPDVSKNVGTVEHVNFLSDLVKKVEALKEE